MVVVSVVALVRSVFCAVTVADDAVSEDASAVSALTYSVDVSADSSVPAAV